MKYQVLSEHMGFNGGWAKASRRWTKKIQAKSEDIIVMEHDLLYRLIYSTAVESGDNHTYTLAVASLDSRDEAVGIT